MAEVQKNRASTIRQLEIRIRRRTKFEISTVYSERTHLIQHVHVYRVYINPIHVKYVPLFPSLCAVFYIDFDLRHGLFPHILLSQHREW